MNKMLVGLVVSTTDFVTGKRVAHAQLFFARTNFMLVLRRFLYRSRGLEEKWREDFSSANINEY